MSINEDSSQVDRVGVAGGRLQFKEVVRIGLESRRRSSDLRKHYSRDIFKEYKKLYREG